MGMFDNVNYKMKCPKCGTEVDNFQSKDSACMLCTVELSDVDNLYASCPNCNCWIEFIRRFKSNDIKDFDMTVEERK